MSYSPALVNNDSKDVYFDPQSAVTKLFSDSDWMVKIGIGGVFNATTVILILTSIYFLPLAIMLMALNTGYMLKVMRMQKCLVKPEASVNNDDYQNPLAGGGSLPAWSNWGDMFFGGLSWIAISLFFQIVIGSLFLAGLFGSSILSAALAGTVSGVGASLIASAVLGVFFLLGQFLHMLVSLAMVNFALSEREAAAFDLLAAFKVFTKNKGQILLAWLFTLGFSVLSIVVPLLTIVGSFLIPSCVFVAQVINSMVLAKTFVFETAESKKESSAGNALL
jgi:hypothetical protein